MCQEQRTAEEVGGKEKRGKRRNGHFYKLPHRRGQSESSSWQPAKRMVHAGLWEGLPRRSWELLALMIHRV